MMMEANNVVSACLNPCFSGCNLKTDIGMNTDLAMGLNPCFSGCNLKPLDVNVLHL